MVDKSAEELKNLTPLEQLLLKIRDAINEYFSSKYKPSTEDPYTGLPWKRYPRGSGMWIKADLPEAEPLKKELEKYGGRLRVGGYDYRFSGDEKQFIARFPVKS